MPLCYRLGAGALFELEVQAEMKLRQLRRLEEVNNRIRASSIPSGTTPDTARVVEEIDEDVSLLTQPRTPETTPPPVVSSGAPPRTVSEFHQASSLAETPSAPVQAFAGEMGRMYFPTTSAIQRLVHVPRASSSSTNIQVSILNARSASASADESQLDLSTISAIRPNSPMSTSTSFGADSQEDIYTTSDGDEL